ncbi:MAG: DoxX-like family protein [Bacteroidota bacterium]
MSDKNKHTILIYILSTVWLVNGLVCKVLNLVPRHEEIVAQILGAEHSRLFTVLIGLSEVIMAIWIFSKFKSKLNAVAQITVVAVMNTLEFILVPDLLLWGKLNSFYALLFIGLVYYTEFVLNKKIRQKAHYEFP